MCHAVSTENHDLAQKTKGSYRDLNQNRNRTFQIKNKSKLFSPIFSLMVIFFEVCIFYVLFSCKIIIFDNSTKHPSRHDSQSGDGTEGSQSQRKKLSPPSAAFVVLLLLVI